MSKMNKTNKPEYDLGLEEWVCGCGNSGFAYSDKFTPCDTYGLPCLPQDENDLFVCNQCGRIHYAVTREVVGFAIQNKLTEGERLCILMSKVNFTLAR